MEQNKKKKFKSISKNKYGWFFVSIASLLIIAFALLPILQALVLSTESGKGLVTEFVGLGNYKRLFSDPMFITAIKNTFLFLIIQVPIMILLSLVISKMLNNKKLKGKGFFRTAVFLPCVTSLVAYSVLFKSMFAVDGIVNTILMNLNFIQNPIPWLLDPFWAKVTIIIAITWRWTGYNMIFYLAGMQNIDSSIYEAAKIDGASPITEFFKITLPMLKPIILLTTITSTIGTLQLFDEVVNITGGGPGNSTMTISQYIYNLSFKFTPNFGYAATVSFAIVVIVAILSFIQFKVAGDKDEK